MNTWQRALLYIVIAALAIAVVPLHGRVVIVPSSYLWRYAIRFATVAGTVFPPPFDVMHRFPPRCLEVVPYPGYML